MANIASQKKRILRSERERTENRLLTSTVKTYFRRLEAAVENGDAGKVEAEHRALGEVLEELRAGSFRVVALGGGAFIQPKNAALMKASGVPIVFLDASVAELWERCCKQAVASGAERPLLRSEQQFRELYEARRKAYLKAPLRIETGGRSVEQIANEIVDRLSLQPMGVRTEQGEVE